MRSILLSASCGLALAIVACGEDSGSTGTTPPGAPVADDVRTAKEMTSDAPPACAPEQVAGDCKRVACADDGTTKTVDDDLDVPASSECATVSCAAGATVSKPKAAGTPCTGGVCDGAGTCAVGVGTACTKAEDCPSGFCTDGVCCNSACGEICKTCSADGAKGICSNVGYYQEDPSWTAPGGKAATCDYAITGAKCDGNSQCLKVATVACLLDEQCMSGRCSNNECLGAPGESCTGCVSGNCSFGYCD
jgi:hypothetical protein